MEYIENDFAQIEHINQVIKNNLQHHSWDCFDTSLLLEQYPQLGYYNKNDPEASYLIIPSGVKTIRGKVVTSHDNIRYNSFIVDIRKYSTKEDDKTVTWWEYLFEVRNTLWNGKYKVSKTTKKLNDKGEWVYEELTKDTDYIVRVGYDETDTENIANGADKNNVIRIAVKENLENGNNIGGGIRICFEMNMASTNRTIEVTNLQLVLDNEDEYVHQYDTTNYESGTVSLNNGINTSNCSVSIEPCDEKGTLLTYSSAVGPWIPPHTVEKVKSDFDMAYGPVSVPGIYYCMMKAVSSNSSIKGSVEKIIKVKKVQNEKAVIDWGDDSLYDNIWKGCKHKYRINFNLQNEYGLESEKQDKLKGVVVNVTFIKSTGKRITQTTTIQKDEKGEYYIEATVSYRGYYDNYSTLEVEVDASAGFGRIMDQRIIKHPWYIAKNFTDIVSQLYYVTPEGEYANEDGSKRGNTFLINDYGTDWIFCDVGIYDIKQPIKIFRDITIAGVLGTKRTIFDGGGKNIIETMHPDFDGPISNDYVSFSKTIPSTKIKVNLLGISLRNAAPAVISGAGTRLLVDKCYFTDNNHLEKHHRGCSIYMLDSDWAIKNKDLWRTEIRSSYFVNNKGNEIQSMGKTKISDNLFKTTSSEFLQQPEVKVVSVRSGEVEYINNTSYINTGKKPMSSNHSYAKALAHVDRNCTFNGKGPSQLKGDMTLPLYGKWNNKAYTYSIYYYPYDNVRTEIVCSPRRGYERKATGHASSAKNWVFYDGYYFLRWERGRNTGNTHDPWTKEELAVPDNMGIFDKVKETFIEKYDPRVSDSKSMTSEFDNVVG